MLDKVLNSKLLWIILGSILLVLIIVLIVIYIPKNNNNSNNSGNNDIEQTNFDEDERDEKLYIEKFELLGEENIKLTVGEKYNELGFKALDSEGNDISEYVTIEGSVDINTPGTYTITYTCLYEKYEEILERKVEVANSLTPILTLNGNEKIYVALGSEYKELGAKASLNNVDKSSEIKVNGIVNTSLAGNYTITYSYQTAKIERTVIVIDPDSYFEIKEENEKAIISVNLDEKIKCVKMPDGVLSYDQNIVYEINENGTYTFSLYLTDDQELKKQVVIANIKKSEVEETTPTIPEQPDTTPYTPTTPAPTGTCTATLYDGSTTFEVKTNDNNIKTYNYNGTVKSNKTYKVSKYIRDSYVILTNTSGVSSKKITCKTTIKALPVKKPSGSIKYKAESDTLKVYIKEKDGYYLSYIWAKDPVYQLKKEMVKGSDHARPKAILEQVINSNYKNKIVFAFNASGSVYGGYYKPIYSKDKNYVGKEPSPLIILNGTVKMKDYKGLAANYGHTYYLDGSSQFRYFSNGGLKSKSEDERKKLFNSIINNGTQNTFTFTPHLIYNGQLNESAELGHGSAKRQGICQIDSNNFIIVTSRSATTRGVLAFGKYLQSLGCKTAFNLDGGGSIATFYKPRGTNNISILAGNKRSLTTVMYFTEK